jgi:hypothetical protein
MKFICVQPAIDYYTWQVEVMINNFMKNGINPNNIEIVCSHQGSISQKWSNLAEKYNYVRFFFYKDERRNPTYISSIRPHTLYKHWLAFPELVNETIFYHDCDIALAKPAEFTELELDHICYVSDTISYIGANYIRSKGEKYLDLMTSIVGIDKQVVIDNEKDSGGAQYILKGITADFWKKVYDDSELLWKRINEEIRKDKLTNPNMHELQIWCSDMWAVLWNLWVFGKVVRVTPKMGFSWATSPISDWDRYPIYHNAGVTADRKDLFFKGAYQNKLPFDINIEQMNKAYCVYKYSEEILKTKEVSCLL